jgi:hypothetical protein
MKKRMQIKAASCRAPFLYDSEAVYLRPSIASRSFAMLPNFVTDCSSGLLSDGIFTAPSSETTALTTVTGSRVGPPSPSIVAQPARRSILVAEPFPNHDVFITDPVPDQPATQSNEPGWAFFKSNMRRQSTAGFMATVDVQLQMFSRVARLGTELRISCRNLCPWSIQICKRRVASARSRRR